MRGRNEKSLVEQLLTLLQPENEADGRWQSAALQLKEFLDQVPGGFLIYRAEGNEDILFANAALVHMFGCDTEEEFRAYTGNSFRGIVHPDDYRAVSDSIATQIARSQIDLDYVEYRIRRKDGVIRWIEDYGHYIRNKTLGGIFYVFLSDATEKITRQILENREKEKKLENLIEEYDKERNLIRREHLRRLEVIEGLSVDYDSILYADLDENTVLPYRVSTRTVELFDSALHRAVFSSFVGRYVEIWVHPEDQMQVLQALTADYMRERFRENKTFYINYRCVQDEKPLYMQLRIVNVGGDDGIAQAVIGCRNIDDEMRQERLQRNVLEEALLSAKAADVAKNTFLSNISHDMRTPMNAIFGFTEIAKKNAGDNAAVLGYLDRIEEAGRHILDQIDKVLQMTYSQSQGWSITDTGCNLAELVQSVYDEQRARATEKDIALSVEVKLEHPDVFADAEKLRQVLLHLVGNALQYTDRGGRVTVTAAEGTRQENGFIRYTFTVCDTGIGIAADALDRIFRAFEREKNTTQSGRFGAGLGLTIAKNIIEKMEGTIDVTSEVGKGSTFTVTVALRPQTAAPQTGGAGRPDGKVLIVEDNEINLEIETEILTDLGFAVDTAENGKIAVEKIEAAADDEYAFVLMDLQMPVMDGWTASRAIRGLKNPKKAALPIIALSANAFESDVRKSIEAGINEHLSKPMDVPVLLETVKKVLRG